MKMHEDLTLKEILSILKTYF